MNRAFLEVAEKAQPELMRKTAMALSLIEKMAPEFLGDVLQEFETVSEVTTEKIAGVPDIVKKALPGAIGVAAIVGSGAAASLGTALATDLFDIAKRGLTKSRNYKRIMEHNPHLQDEIVDKGRLKPAFNALHRYAPDFMADPLVGGSLLKQLANQAPGNEYQIITTLIGSRKNLVDIKKNQFSPDFRPKEKKDSFEQRVSLEHAKKQPIQYHQHFHGSKAARGTGTPIALKNPGATPTNE